MKAEEQITAYKSLRDNGQAFFVDTYEDCNRIIEALEKQIPKKPRITLHGTTGYNTVCKCATCGGFVGSGNYCHTCGQAIDWSGEE